MRIMKKYLESGKIINTHGLHGEIKIEPWCDEPEFLLDFKRLFIDGDKYDIIGARVQKSFVYMRLKGVDELEKAIALKGKIISIDRDDRPLPEGEYYLQDLIGLKAVDEDGNDLGTVHDILTLPAGKVYVIRGKREILVPGVDEFVKGIDVDGGIIVFRLIEGM